MTAPFTNLDDEQTTPQILRGLEASDRGWRQYVNLANMSNVVTFVILILGFVLKIVAPTNFLSRYILSLGLFGFAGGITNWLAITMLFDKIPFIYGSGIIPQQFEEIKKTIAAMIMDTFFEPSFFRRQLVSRTKDLGNSDQVQQLVKDMFASQAFADMLDRKLEAVQESNSVGGVLMKTFNIQGATLRPTLRKIIVGVAPDFASLFLSMFDPESFFDEAAVNKMRQQIDLILEDRLKELTPEKVKRLMEMVIRVHLGWLVVWGNVFGALIGVICTAVGY